MDLKKFAKLKGHHVVVSEDPPADARALYAQAAEAKLPAEIDGVVVARKDPDTGVREASLRFELPRVILEPGLPGSKRR